MIDVFLSYPREVDLQDDGAIIRLCQQLEREVKLQTGEKITILHDQKDIEWGRRWTRFLSETPGKTNFLLAVITESYFRSAGCRVEYDAFRTREKKLGQGEQILPLYYVEVRDVKLESDPKIRRWKRDIMARQYADWRKTRNVDPNSSEYKLNLAKLARQFGRLLGTPANGDVKRPSPARHAATQPPVAPAKNPVLYELLEQGNQTSLRLLDTNEEFLIDYTPIIQSNLAQFGIVRQDFEKLIVREVLSHRLMLRYDYEDRAIPLLSGMTVIVTKRNNRLVLEWLTRPQASPAIDDAWQRLCRAYYVATRLPYRIAHELLLAKRTRADAIEKTAELVLEANRFFVETVRMDSQQMHPEFLDRKNRAERCLIEAEEASYEFDDKNNTTAQDLGNFVVALELTISNVHKMMLDYSRYRKL